MAKNYIDTLPAAANSILTGMMTHLKNFGWVHQASGQGTAPGGTFTTTPGNINDLIPGGFGDFAWWVGRAPDNQRELMFQFEHVGVPLGPVGGDGYFRIKYSQSTHFTGGVPSATNPPTATDATNILGDDTPTYFYFVRTGGATRLKMMVQDTAPYGFWMFCHPNGGGVGTTAFAMDPVKVGSYAPQEVDPYVFVICGCSTSEAYRLSSWASGDDDIPRNNRTCYSWLNKGMIGESWVDTAGVYPISVGSTWHMTTNPHTGSYDVYPALYARCAEASITGSGYGPWNFRGNELQTGFKGISSLFALLGTDYAGGPLVVGDTLSLGGVRDKIVLGALCADWDGSVPL